MKDIFYKTVVLIVGASLLVFGGCTTPTEQQEDHDAPSGKILSDGDFNIRLRIFETGVEPQYRIHAFRNDSPIRPQEIKASIRLTRLGDRKENISFKPVGTFLVSDQEIREPHSFDVHVEVDYEGRKHTWDFSSYEARTEIPDNVAARSGVQTDQVSSHPMKTIVAARGKIIPSEHRIAHIIPRFSGIVREGKKHIGDKVEKGEVVAIIESNQSLQPFEVRSQIAGTVVNGHLIVGEFVPENQWVYIIADLTDVWADFFVPLKERTRVHEGQQVQIRSLDEGTALTGTISYVAPYADEKSQSQLVRVVIPNLTRTALPGMFVTGDIVTEEFTAPLAVKENSLQTFREWDVVFIKSGTTYEARPVTLGRRDNGWVEVTSGLEVGDVYVTGNAFLIKADILKSGATHDH